MSSPDGRTRATVALDDGGRLTWRVSRGESEILAESPLGIRRADQDFRSGLRTHGLPGRRSIDERYEMPHGKRRHHHVRGREIALPFANAAGARVDVILRAHDDGVAVRYRFPEKSAETRTVVEELTGFRVPQGATAWMMPYQKPWDYGHAYEDWFHEVPAGTSALKVGTVPSEPIGWSFPALFKTKDGRWLLVTEAALDEHYSGTHLAADAPDGLYRVAFPHEQEVPLDAKARPASRLPWTLPWRVVIVGDAAARILESDLVLDLSPPSRLRDISWVKPGRASWSWWSESDSPRHAAKLNAFVDLCAEMGWEYSLVDANWNRMDSGRIEDVIEHARARGVGLLFWYNSAGPHNPVTEQPRDRMHTRELRRAEFARLKAWGVKGVKVDYWHSDKQPMIRLYRDILEDAADFQMLVNFHGSTMPRGWSREFPHLVTMESVFGAEQYKLYAGYPAKSGWHNTVLPFTRNVVGPMDFTPVAFTDLKYPRRTTNGHELALAVVFESGIQHFADSVAGYRALPDAPKAFLRQVPGAWDETRALGGEPGRTVVVARRAARDWYVGALNGQDASASTRVDLGFLGDGAWTMTLIRDGSEDRSFESGTKEVGTKDVVEVPMRARGGFVMRLTRR